MQKILVVFFLAFGCSSCIFFSKYKRDEFRYVQAGGEQNLALLLPKGFQTSKQIVDSAGNTIKSFRYANGGTIYFAAMIDSNVALQTYDTMLHLPLLHPFGGLMYKGIGTDNRIWREIRNKQFRAGYYQVPIDVEGYFDSSLNYVAREYGKRQ